MSVFQSLMRHGLVKSAVGASIEHVRRQASIRALELELGLREWDHRDEVEARHRMLAQVRYVTPEGAREFVERERVRLTGGGRG